MSARKFKKSWWVDLRINRTRYRIRSPENSRTGALAFEATVRSRLARGETVEGVIQSIEQQQTFEEFAWKWFETYAIPNNRYGEQRVKKYTLQSSLIPFFGKMKIGEIKGYHIEQYKARRIQDGLTNKTIKNHLTVLNKCLASAYEWLEFRSNPPKIHWPKCRPPKTDYLSEDEGELLVSHADGITREMILMALRTGMGGVARVVGIRLA